MRSPWELAAAALRRLRVAVEAVQLAASGLAEAALLLARLVSALIRVLRSLLTIVVTLAYGCRVVTELAIRIHLRFPEFAAAFSPATRERYTEEYRQQQERFEREREFERREIERMLRRRERQRAREAAELERAERRRARRRARRRPSAALRVLLRLARQDHRVAAHSTHSSSQPLAERFEKEAAEMNKGSFK